jgi:methyltransferase (TIGR00027 family)
MKTTFVTLVPMRASRGTMELPWSGDTGAASDVVGSRSMNPVAITGLLVAAQRAEESRREDRLFDDPFAEALAGEEGTAVLARYRDSGTAGTVPIIEVRTRWYDDEIAHTIGTGIRQVVILAAGMDSRAYRLEWPRDARVFELDQPEVIAEKTRRLRGAAPRCAHAAIGVNLAHDFVAALEAQSFERADRTLWLIEGLLSYLPRRTAEAILGRIEACAAPRSIALFDVLGQSLLDSPVTQGTRQMMQELGAPWIFGTDEPELLLRTWRAAVTEPAVLGNRWKRWPVPAAPRHIRGVPRSYLVQAEKR